MSNRYCYQNEGEKASMGIGWWLTILSAGTLWFWKSLPLSWLWK